MYSLDINFLNDRPEYRPEPTERRRRGGTPETKRPLYLGLITALALLGLAGGAWFFLQNQNSTLTARKAELDAELGALKAEQAKLSSINAQTKQIRDETVALASVFNAIKPWSATFNDISSRTPPRIRIEKIEEKAPPANQRRSSPSPSPSPGAAAAATPMPERIVEISGKASSFDDVNDFLLVLQKSKFLQADETKILTAEMGDPRVVTPPRLGQNAPSSNVRLELPAEVGFTIQTKLSDIPASDLLQELETNGATGLVTRIETLQQKGVTKP